MRESKKVRKDSFEANKIKDYDNILNPIDNATSFIGYATNIDEIPKGLHSMLMGHSGPELIFPKDK